MSAVWMRVRAEMRGRWRAWLALALLVGVFGGAAIAAAAGARRTATAYPRFVEAQNGFDVITGTVPENVADPKKVFAEIESIPQVKRACYGTGFVSSQVILESGRIIYFPDVLAVSAFGSECEDLNRPKVLRGRLYDRDAPHEVMVSFTVAERFGIEVGDRLTLPVGGTLDAPTDEVPQVPVAVTVVGIEASPGEFESISGSYLPILTVTPAFIRRYGTLLTEPMEREGPTIQLKRGAADLEGFLAEMERRDIQIDIPMKMAEHVEGVQRSIRFESGALWLLAGLVALTALAVFGQALARQTFLESAEHPTLRALGMSRGQLAATGMIRAGLAGLAGAAIAVAAALALSPLTPIGLARIVEPDPGLALDAGALGVGAAAVLVLVLAVSALPAWRAARVSASALGLADLPEARRPSATANALARASMPATAVAGVRMALEPGRGRTAVPVRTTIAGTAVAVAALAMAVTFSSSLDHLLATPRLSGFTWDAIIAMDSEGAAEAKRLLDADPDIAAAWEMEGGSLIIDGRPEPLALAFDLRGPFRPALVEGRVPVDDNEIALGTQTLRSLDRSIGETVRVALSEDFSGRPGGPEVSMRVVGRVAVPQFFFAQTEPGRGAVLSYPGLARLQGNRESFQGGAYFVRFRPGADRDAALARVTERLAPYGPFPLPGKRAADITNLSRISGVPVALSGLLAVMAAGIVAHTLVSAARRRRRDLAVLKTLGFVRRQVRATIAWQATTTVVLALAIGIPLGLAAGRWAWRVFTDQLGVVPEPIVPGLVLAVVVPGALLLANVIAALPARAAARIRPAAALRTE